MKAIITRKNQDGSYDNVGMRNRFLANHYKTVKSLMRYGISENWRSRGVRVEIFNYNLYQEKPDKIIYI